MPILAIYLLVAAFVATAGYFGVEAIKDAGRNEIRSEIRTATDAAHIAAREKRDETAAAVDAIETANESAAAKDAGEREGLRDERKSDGDGERVVFDQRWDAWLRGGKAAVRPGS